MILLPQAHHTKSCSAHSSRKRSPSSPRTQSEFRTSPSARQSRETAAAVLPLHRSTPLLVLTNCGVAVIRRRPHHAKTAREVKLEVRGYDRNAPNRT